MTTINEFFPVYLKDEVADSQELQEKTANETEYELAQRAAGGDINAFEQIYWKHHRRVYSVCLRMTKNPAEAEDVTQLIFLNLFRKIGSFRGESAFSTWLHRMTINQMLMHFRSAKIRKEDTTEDGELPESAFARSLKPNEANRLVDRLQLERAIEQLPDGYRKIFILHDIEGYEHEEIARMLNCASGTSKSQLFKARRKLQRLLAADTLKIKR